MLIASNTVSPFFYSYNIPVANGKLYVKADNDAESKNLELFRDADFLESAPNPITLNSAGEIPYPVYTKEDVASCFLYSSEYGIRGRSYPLIGMPGRNAAAEQDAQLQTIEVGTLADAEKMQGIKELSCGAINSENIEIGGTASIGKLKVKELTIKGRYFNSGEISAIKAVPSPARLGTGGSSWWDNFLVGSYGVWAGGAGVQHIGDQVKATGISDDGSYMVTEANAPAKAICQAWFLLDASSNDGNGNFTPRRWLVCKIAEGEE